MAKKEIVNQVIKEKNQKKNNKKNENQVKAKNQKRNLVSIDSNVWSTFISILLLLTSTMFLLLFITLILLKYDTTKIATSETFDGPPVTIDKAWLLNEINKLNTDRSIIEVKLLKYLFNAYKQIDASHVLSNLKPITKLG